MFFLSLQGNGSASEILERSDEKDEQPIASWSPIKNHLSLKLQSALLSKIPFKLNLSVMT